MLASSEFQNIISDIGIHEFKLRFLNLSETEDKHYLLNKKILAVDQLAKHIIHKLWESSCSSF